jgi:hypothetical protein
MIAGKSKCYMNNLMKQWYRDTCTVNATIEHEELFQHPMRIMMSTTKEIMMMTLLQAFDLIKDIV